MAKYVCNGATMQCLMAVPPGTTSLTVLPDKRIKLQKQPMASIFDFVPFVNIPTFGMCCSPDNEAVVAANGSPVPCTPLILEPWDAPKENVFGAKQQALLDNATCNCMLGGGTIFIVDAGQTTTKEK